MKIPVIGTVFTDIKGHPFDKFIPDGRNPGWIEHVHGGVGRNIAEDLAALGADPVFVSLVSPGGDEIIRHLRLTGVDTRFIQTAENGSGTWLAVYNEDGDVVSSISARAELKKLAAVVEENHEEIFADAQAIILEVDIDTPVVERVFHYAEKHRTPVFCAVATMSRALDKTEYLRQAELFICNRQEACMLFKEDLTVYSPEELAAKLPGKLKAFGLKRMIVTMSELGSVHADANGISGVCPAENIIPADTTGAGDSYCAGAVLALAKGASMPEACRFGAHVSAAVVASHKNVIVTNKNPIERNHP